MAKKAIPLNELPVADRNSLSSFTEEDYKSGSVLLLDKPLEWSSFQVVKYVRNRLPVKKVGHAGTLDPLATGLLVLCCGKATKSISQIQNGEKEYVAEVKFGESTPSYDAALDPDEFVEWDHIKEEDIRSKLEELFTGTISQKPPIYSAIKVKGERLYKKARRGETVEIKPRDVHIYEIELLKCDMPRVTMRIRCGKGTYIRSLAHDLGIALGSRAHLAGLRRTKIGAFHVDDAMTPEEFNIKIESD